MPTAKKLPSGSWRCRVYVGKSPDGKPVYRSFTASNKKQAEMEAMFFARENKQPESELTLENAIERYIEAKSSILSPSTIRSYEGIKHTAFPSIIDLPLSRITQEKQQIAINEYAANRSPKTVRNASGLLYSVMKLYCPDHAYSLSLPQPRKKHITIPDNEQVEKLLDSTRGTWLFTAIVLASCLGLRRSEIAALKLSDFDFDKSILHVQRAMVWSNDRIWVIKSTKTTESDRVLSVPSNVLKIIRSLENTESEYLIGHPPSTITRNFSDALRALGLSFRFHDLRHYYASVLLAIGVPDQYAMKRMGHSTTNMLKTVYQHIMKDKDEEVDYLIEKKLKNLF